jgi:GNAT superfamily N-acetyltransferase
VGIMHESGYEVVIKKPNDCSNVELQDFGAFVLASGEVSAVGLSRRIEQAEALAFLLQGNCLKGIAALKRPAQSYKVRVFESAEATANAGGFPYEMGWVFVLPSSRGSGFSHRLVHAAIAAAVPEAVFATSRTDNTPMHRVLAAHGFSRHGQPFASRRGNQNLVLFVSGVEDRR